MASTDIERTEERNDFLRSIKTIADAERAFAEQGMDDAIDAIGTGFEVLQDKGYLIDVPFIVVDFDFKEGDNGQFVTAFVVTKNSEKFIVNDGSTGLMQQLAEYRQKTGRSGGLICKKGLRVSRYEVEVEGGKSKKAETYYINV